MTTKPGPGRPHLTTSPFKPHPEPLIDRFAVGDRVSHDKYGLGRVTGADSDAVTVDFVTQKVRVTSPYRKMKKL
ncbi:MAG: hypothetical protein J2P23_08325 [Microlunatus sp.]|nr:hypothetical protein [Microlunatus sp.]